MSHLNLVFLPLEPDAEPFEPFRESEGHPAESLFGTVYEFPMHEWSSFDSQDI